MDFKTYYRELFKLDLNKFIAAIPSEGNKHYDTQDFAIQYFTLTPRYRYLDSIPPDRQPYFAVALFWMVLVDQVFYSNHRKEYSAFQKKTLYPKFIGNCTAPSLMSSECGHHQNPHKILQAINDFKDRGNRFEIDREVFRKDESSAKREVINIGKMVEQTKEVMKEEIQSYFDKHESPINWIEFWTKCEKELS